MRTFEYGTAVQASEDVRAWLRRHCSRITVVGSVRREMRRVHDLDVLIFPRDTEALRHALVERALTERIHIRTVEGMPWRFVHCASGVPVDLFLAPTMDQWWGLLVLTTGSKKFCAWLKRQARKKTYTLHSDGRLELAKGRFARQRSERALFRAVGVPWLAPGARA